MIIDILDIGYNYPSGYGLLTRLRSESLSVPSTKNINDYCYCNIECEFTENVFAKIDGEWWENDKNTFLYKKLTSYDTVVIELYKNDVLVGEITDDTYGTYYDSFTAQPLYVGFIIDWEKVLDESGTGLYQIITTTTIMGIETEIESPVYSLQYYNDILADGTVRIECYQTGNILSSEFDYTGLLTGGWYQSYRIKGKLLPKIPKLIIDNYLDQDYKLIQIQDKIQNEWTLETNLLPSNISNQLIYDNLLSNKFLITDYNLMNEEVVRRLELYPTEITEKKSYNNNRKSKFIIKFAESKDNIIKTNY